MTELEEDISWFASKFVNKVHLGNCLDILKTLPDNCIDAIVSDPPYGLGTKEPTGEDIDRYLSGESRLDTGGDFMGHSWDIPSVAVFKECYRVLKPGRHVLCFAGCYDEHTEVLTRRGWVHFPDVKQDDWFASLDLGTHLVEWQQPSEVVRQPHPGPMYQYKTKKIDLLVTPNHSMVISTLGDDSRTFRLERADQHCRAIRMLKNSRGLLEHADPGHILLPAEEQLTSHGHTKMLPARPIPLDVWLPFFGLWLAEGSVSLIKHKPQNGHEHGSGYIVQICHFDIENLREIGRLLSPWFNVRVYPNIGVLRINDQQLVSYLRPFGKAWEKFIPDWIKQLPAERLRVLWDWYMRGDGHDHRVGYTSSPRLRDDWQEVALYMGISADWVQRKPRLRNGRIKGREIIARRPQYEVTFNHTQSQPMVYDGSFKKPVRTMVPAKDWAGREVFCVELPRHHTLYVRRNGKAVWCGNTRTWDLMAAGMRAAGFTPQGGIAEKFGLPLLQWIHGQGFPKSLDIAKAIDKHLGVKREVLGERTVVQGGGTSLELRMGERREVQVQVTAPTSPEAKKWEGWGTALKPAWEPVIAFIKPGPDAGFKPPDFPFRYVSKITASEADAGLDPNAYLEGTKIEKNSHPTRKPLKIMDWLIGLVSAPGEVVLDPFCGSGTTCVSAVWLGRQWAGCELDPKFHAIACERVRVASEQTSAIQKGHFDAAIDLADRPDDESLPPMQLEVLQATTIPALEALPTMPSPPPVPERNSLFDLAMDDD